MPSHASGLGTPHGPRRYGLTPDYDPHRHMIDYYYGASFGGLQVAVSLCGKLVEATRPRPEVEVAYYCEECQRLAVQRGWSWDY